MSKKYSNKELMERGKLALQEEELIENIDKLEKINDITKEVKKTIKIAKSTGDYEIYKSLKVHLNSVKKSNMSFNDKSSKYKKLLRNSSSVIKKYDVNPKAVFQDSVINELVELRQSEKYKAMVNSAMEQRPEYSEYEFFHSTVVQVINDGGKWISDSKEFINDLNVGLSNSELDVVDVEFINMIMKK